MLRHVSITNLGPFKNFNIHLLAQRPAQMVTITGANNTGKTMLLRAIALSLVSNEMACAAVQALRKGLSRPDIKACANIAVQWDGEIFRTMVGNDRERQGHPEWCIEVEKAPTAVKRPWIYAYGSERTTAIGRFDQSVAVHAPAYDIASLFSGDYQLLHAEPIFTRLAFGALLDDGDKTGPTEFQRSILTTLCMVLPGVKSIHTSSDTTFFSGEEIGDNIPMQHLASGYLLTLGWIMDLLARWIKRIEPSKPIDLPSRMNGIVLIDDFDRSLSPDWHARIMDGIRLAFPQLTFVVTTHLPVSLLETCPGQIIELRRHQGDILAVRHR